MFSENRYVQSPEFLIHVTLSDQLNPTEASNFTPNIHHKYWYAQMYHDKFV